MMAMYTHWERAPVMFTGVCSPALNQSKARPVWIPPMVLCGLGHMTTVSMALI